MKPQAFQPGELRDEHDQIIRAGAYGKKTPFVSSDNNAILDYIMNNFDVLYAQIPSSGGTNITVDSTLSSTSTNPVENKVIYAALNNKLDKTGTAAAATKATQDSYGNVIATTYARKSDLSGYVKTINNQEPDASGNINISTGGTNVVVDTTLSSTSTNPIANKAVYAAVNSKLDKTGIAAYATRDSSGNIISSTYAPLDSPTFTGAVTAANVTVSNTLTIPGGKVWIE